MKQIRRFSLFLILSVLSFCSFASFSFGQTRTFSMDYQVTAAAINRYLASQTFPTLSGSYSSYTYNITITKPFVQLNTNSATVQFTIQANTSIGNYIFTIQPTFTIPNLGVSLSQITAVIQQFDVIINARADIPSWLKPIIINGYNNLNFIVYPSKLLDYANTQVPNWADITVTNISVSFSVIQDALDFTFTPTVQGTPPVFTLQWQMPVYGQLNLQFGSTVATTIYEIRVFNALGQERYKSTNFYCPINKGGTSQLTGISGLATGAHYVTIMYHSEHGAYMRYYSFNYYATASQQWYDATLSRSVN